MDDEGTANSGTGCQPAEPRACNFDSFQPLKVSPDGSGDCYCLHGPTPKAAWSEACDTNTASTTMANTENRWWIWRVVREKWSTWQAIGGLKRLCDNIAICWREWRLATKTEFSEWTA
ncbi:MAG: hypothetical protein ACYCOR_15365 [Acidobacteriaceae bacterium]